MAHPVIHIELAAPNHEQLAKWYADLFDWDFSPFPDVNYATSNWSDGPARTGMGFMPANDLVPFGTLTLYIWVDDVDRYMERIVTAGGSAVGAKEEAPGIGIWWRFRDPSGNYMAVMTPDMSAMPG